MKTGLLVTIIAITIALVGLAACEQSDAGKVILPETPPDKKLAGSTGETESPKLSPDIGVGEKESEAAPTLTPEVSVVTLPGRASSVEITIRENVVVREVPQTLLGATLGVRENILVTDIPTVTPVISVVTSPVTALPQLPSPPKLVSPGSGSSPGTIIGSLTPTLQWSDVSGADNYGIYVFDTTLKTPVFDSQAKGIQLKGTVYTLPSGVLQSGKSYYWYMNAHNNAGWGTNSAPLYFQTQAVQQPAQPLSPPKLVSPGSEASPGPTITSLMPTLQWSAVSGADGYAIYVFDVAAKSVIFDSRTKQINITGTSYTLPQGVLASGKKYYWYMNTRNSAGWGSNSGFFYFQTQAPKQ